MEITRICLHLAELLVMRALQIKDQDTAQECIQQGVRMEEAAEQLRRALLANVAADAVFAARIGVEDLLDELAERGLELAPGGQENDLELVKIPENAHFSPELGPERPGIVFYALENPHGGEGPGC